MMQRLRFLTAGESHGQALICILEGMPAGLDIGEAEIERDLRRRQRGYGRGDRMRIERDGVKLLSGVRYGRTLGGPIAMILENRDWPNWQKKMSTAPVEEETAPLQMPRPGHADFAGMVKYRQNDLRNVLERSSARETAMRVACGAIARRLLEGFGITIHGHVRSVGAVTCRWDALSFFAGKNSRDPRVRQEFLQTIAAAEASEMACADEATTQKMKESVDQAKGNGDTLGGAFELIGLGLPVGLGSHVHWDRRLDTALAAAMMSIPAIKAVEIGLGVRCSELPGSRVHDEIFFDPVTGYYRLSDNAGGIEGGISNGEPLVVRLTMKPLPTLARPLRSVDIATHEPREAFNERADTCSVPAAVVIGEAMMSLVVADALMEKLGGDSMQEMIINFGNLANVPLGW